MHIRNKRGEYLKDIIFESREPFTIEPLRVNSLIVTDSKEFARVYPDTSIIFDILEILNDYSNDKWKGE